MKRQLPGRRMDAGHRRRPRLESLEGRQLPATFLVTSTADSGVGSLRQAILSSNAASGSNTIDFDIPGTGPFTIVPGSALPRITSPVILDGTSEPGYSGSPLIVLSGDLQVPDGLDISAGDSTVKGLAINQFGNDGILLESKGGDTVAQCYIGTDATGLLPHLGNVANGVEIQGSPGDTIGGTSEAAMNVISGNLADGVKIDDSSTTSGMSDLIQYNDIGVNLDDSTTVFLGNGTNGISILGGDQEGENRILDNTVSRNNLVGIRISGTTGNVLAGNFIGTDADGDALGNFTSGVTFLGSSNNTIGGTTASLRDVISDNQQNGVYLEGEGSTGNLVEGNLIGLEPSGEKGLGNVLIGIAITDAPGNTIGGTVASASNLIGNNVIGVQIESFDAPTLYPAGFSDENVVEGDLIGTDASGSHAMGNFQAGLLIQAGSHNTIGGTVSGVVTVVSNNGVGVEIQGDPTVPDDPTAGNVVQGDEIGTDESGTVAMPNLSDGVLISGAPLTTIGGATPAARDLISGNSGNGIRVSGPSSSASILGDDIGVDSTGLASLGNKENGIDVEGASGVTIGGSTSGDRDVISGNSSAGIQLDGGSVGNLVEGDLIGLASGGLTPLGNNQSGVFIAEKSSNNTIGGASTGSGNVISGNAIGLMITNSGTSNNLVEGNLIGLGFDGSKPVGNVAYGVLLLDGGSGNTIGGTSSGAGNVVSGNTGVGVELFGPETSSNLVAGNIVGLDASGSSAVENGGFGVLVENAPDNTIGGTAPAARDTISGNRQAGVDIEGQGSAGTLIEGNDIGTGLSGGLALGNKGDGILIDGAPSVVVGGFGAPAPNLISGNTANGVEVDGSDSTGDQILGNLIGTDATGLLATVGNGLSGVSIDGAPGVLVGGTLAPLRNVISGNSGDGVLISDVSTTGIQVEGNYIGLGVDGKTAVPNGTVGVTVGGTASGASNVISGNASAGVEFTGQATSGDVLEGNLIGTDATGTAPSGNSTGVLVDGSPQDLIGGSAPDSGNLVSGNAVYGIHIQGTTAIDDVVQGNRIGTDLAGEVPVANQAGVFLDGAPSNLLMDDLISGNSSSDAIIQGGAARGNILLGDLVGIDATGSKAVGPADPNPDESGVLILDAPGNVLSSNVLSGNGVGVVISGDDASGNTLLGNFIGTNAAGARPVANVVGVYINGSPSNTIGGTTHGSGNVISGNLSTAVNLFGNLTVGNLVEGNLIGTDVTGTVGVADPAATYANATGVYIEQAPSNTIGGSSTPAGNLISANPVAGVYIYNQASGNVVRENRIGVTSTGKPLGNLQYGVLLYNAADNTIDMSKATGNLIANSGTGNFREYTGPTSTTTTSKETKAVVQSAHPAGPKAEAVGPGGPQASRRGVSPRSSAPKGRR